MERDAARYDQIANKVIKDSLTKVQEALLAAEVSQIGETTPYFWDVRPSSRQKRMLMKQTADELMQAKEYASEQIRDNSMSFATLQHSAGTVTRQGLWHPGLAIRQLGKTEHTVEWQNQ
ncbi:MAG TPA: hypothetical protein VGH13_12045 [Xanthobacteraceae bacterium]